MATLDLVIQSPALDGAAVEAFAAACLAARVRRRDRCARLDGVDDGAESRRVIAALAAYWKCDAALVPPQRRGSDFRVLVLDMDSTLITIEGIDELARLAGCGDAVAAITDAAMRGAIGDYAQSLRQRVALLAGAPAGLIERVYRERMQLSPGARLLLAGARARGWRTVLVSGGFTALAERVRTDLGIGAVWANDLQIEGGRLTGTVAGPPQNDGRIVDAAAKARALRAACADAGCAPAQAIAVGDGVNDLEMLAAAGLSIAFRAKPRVRAAAAVALDHAGLDGILNLFADGW